MAAILTRLVHRNCVLKCTNGCATFEAVDFGVHTKNGIEITPTVIGTIIAAAKTHVTTAHRMKGTVEIQITSAFIVWKDSGNGVDFMTMDSDRARKQIQLARDRGCIDRLYVEFKTKATAPQENHSETQSTGNDLQL